jgi:hypothetical protein
VPASGTSASTEAPPAAGRSRIASGGLVAVGIGLVAAIALLSHAATPEVDSIALAPPSPLGVIEVLGYVAVLVGLVLIPVVVIFGRRQQPRNVRVAAALHVTTIPRWASIVGLVVVAAVVFGQIGVLLLYLDDLRRGRDSSTGAPQGTGALGESTSATGALAGPESLVVAVVIVAILAVLVVALYVRSRRTDGPLAPSPERQASFVAAPLGAGLDALRREQDPRRAVIRAYAAMERSMASIGVERDAPETATEYLRKVLARWPTVGEEVATLSRLFQLAKFSRRAISQAMRSDAIDALEQLTTATGEPR